MGLLRLSGLLVHEAAATAWILTVDASTAGAAGDDSEVGGGGGGG